MSKKILFYPVHEVYLNYMKPICTSLAKDPDCEVEIFLDNCKFSSEFNEFKQYILDTSLRSLDNKNYFFRRDNFLTDIIKQSPFVQYYKFLRDKVNMHVLFLQRYNEYLKLKCRMYLLLKNIRPHTVVLSGDRHRGYELPLIWACNKLNIKSVVIPVGGPAPPSFLSTLRRSNPSYFASKKFTIQYPDNCWLDSKTGRWLSFYPTLDTLVFDKLNILPKNPKYYGGGQTTKVLFDNHRFKDKAVKNGVDSGKLEVTGNLMYDDLYKIQKRKLKFKEISFSKYKFQKNIPLLVVALPQLAEHNLISWDKHWYYVEEILKSLNNKRLNVLVSLHPKMSLQKYIYLESKFKIKISKEPLSKILPLADHYFGVQGSTTIDWAIILQIPTLVMDFFGVLNYDIYSNVVGINVAKNLHFFKNYVDKISHFDKEAEFQSNFSDEQIFDGRCLDRISNILK